MGRVQVHKLTQKMGIGAQFGGKYFCHDVRVVRLPRHGASCPIGLGVSCSADRQAVGKITKDGVFLEALETDPSKYLPEVRVCVCYHRPREGWDEIGCSLTKTAERL